MGLASGDTDDIIRLVLVDDHPVVLKGLSAVLEQESDLEIVALASSGSETLDAARRTQPDVVLLDLQIPEPKGAELIRRLAVVSPASKVMILTTYDDDEHLIEAVGAGAVGYTLKGSPMPDVVDAIRRVSAGESLIEPSLTRKLLDRLSSLSRFEEPVPSTPPITDREQQVLQELVRGASNRQIADTLFISERTVKAHLASIFDKLDVRDRASASATAVKLGLVELG